MRKMDKWFAGAPFYWFLLGALWCAASVACLWEGRALLATVPLFAAAVISFAVGARKCWLQSGRGFCAHRTVRK